MSEKKETIRMIDDESIIEFRTDIKGWVGKESKVFYGNINNAKERALYGEATHRKCKCGNIMEKHWTACSSCRSKKTRENYLKLQEVEWDGKTPLCLYHDDAYFFGVEDIEDYCESDNIEPEDMMFVLCEKEKPQEINIDELNEEYCDEDGRGVTHFHPDIAKKVDELNELIRNTEGKLWFSTNKRVTVKASDLWKA